MEVRAVTVFADFAGGVSTPARLAELGARAGQVRARLEAAGFQVQSTRLATPPVESWCRRATELPDRAAALEADAAAGGFRHVALGTLGVGASQAEFIAAVPATLAATQWVFTSAELARAGDAALDAAAQTICLNRDVVADGFANLRFAAVFDLPHGGPFFPAAWQAPGAPDTLALAIEGADLAVGASRAPGMDGFTAALRHTLEEALGTLAATASAAAREADLAWGGMDCSLAPYPADDRSLGAAVEQVTGVHFGGAGTCAAVAAMKQAIDLACFPRTGFCAPMLLPLEDSRLALRSGEATYGWDTLLACATAGSSGLDVVPVPGGVEPARVARALADVRALARAAGRPLQVRLLPLPGCEPGQRARSSFAYFAPAGVLALP